MYVSEVTSCQNAKVYGSWTDLCDRFQHRHFSWKIDCARAYGIHPSKGITEMHPHTFLDRERQCKVTFLSNNLVCLCWYRHVTDQYSSYKYMISVLYISRSSVVFWFVLCHKLVFWDQKQTAKLHNAPFSVTKIKFSGEGIASQGLTHPHPHTTPVLLRIRNMNVYFNIM